MRFLSSCLPRISGQPAQQRQNQSSDGVPERHHKNIEQRTQTPHTADRKEIHIRDAVLEAAENKRHHAEKQSQIFADFVRVMLKAVYSDKNQQIAEDCEQEAAAQIIRQLGFAQQRRASRELRRDSRQHQKPRGQNRACQISEPDERQLQGIVLIIFKEIAHASGVKLKIHRADRKQAHSEKKCSDDLIFNRKIDPP